MKDNYAIIDNDGVISDGFDTEIEAKEDFERLVNEGDFEIKGKVILVKIIDYLT